MKDGTDSYANYSFSKFARKETSISQYIETDAIKVVDLQTLLGEQPTVEEIETMVEAALNGSDNDTTAPKKVDSLSAIKADLGNVGKTESSEPATTTNVSDAAEDILNDIMSQNA